MTKSVLISIQPQHAMNILNGDKTIELRKVVLNWVKEEVAKGNSVKFLMYVTKALPYVIYTDGYIGGIYVGDEYTTLRGYSKERAYRTFERVINGKIVASFEVSKIEDVYLDLIDKSGYDEDFATWFETNTLYGDVLSNLSCLNQDDMERYFTNEKGYALHIDNLKIIEPMELSELYNPNLYATIETIKEYEEKNPNDKGYRLSRPPQNMQTVWYEEKKNE